MSSVMDPRYPASSQPSEFSQHFSQLPGSDLRDGTNGSLARYQQANQPSNVAYGSRFAAYRDTAYRENPSSRSSSISYSTPSSSPRLIPTSIQPQAQNVPSLQQQQQMSFFTSPSLSPLGPGREKLNITSPHLGFAHTGELGGKPVGGDVGPGSPASKRGLDSRPPLHSDNPSAAAHAPPAPALRLHEDRYLDTAGADPGRSPGVPAWARAGAAGPSGPHPQPVTPRRADESPGARAEWAGAEPMQPRHSSDFARPPPPDADRLRLQVEFPSRPFAAFALSLPPVRKSGIDPEFIYRPTVRKVLHLPVTARVVLKGRRGWERAGVVADSDAPPADRAAAGRRRWRQAGGGGGD